VSLLAIVAQKGEAVRRYVEETGLAFDILVDETRRVAKSYGVWHAWGLDAYNIARPAVFLIDRSGTIRYSFIAKRQNQYPSGREITAEIDKMLNAEG
jgi:glutaredoxin-dependent peroxiredoxin